ncbi:hypothetical protein OROHE_020106 [Orobanche hederae]
MSSQEILKIRDGTPLEAEGILTYRKSPRHGSVWHFSSKLDVPSNVVMNKRVARILVFKIRPSQEILKNRDGTPLEAEIILTYRKKPSKWIEPSQEILKIRDDVPSNVVQKKRVAWILVLKIRSSQEILKIRDAPLEAEGILTYKKKPSKWIGFTLFYKLDVPSNVVQKKRVARILVFKMRPSQEILKIRDGTHLEAEGILTYRKKPSKWIEILKIRDGTPLEWSSQEILKIRDGTPLEAEGILIYKKKPSKWIGFTLFYKLDVPSNVVQKKRVARILVFKIRPSQEILKIRDGTPLEAEGILTYRKKPSKWIEPSQEILKIRDGTPLEAKGILTYKKALEMDRPSQEILKIRDGIPLEGEGILTYRKNVPSNVVQKKRVAQILVFKMRPSQEILKIRDGTPLEAEGILTYKKSPRNGSVLHFSSKLDVPSNVVQNKRVAQILVFKIRPSQEILKIRDGTPLEAERILTYRKKPSKWIESSQEILKIRDGTPLEAEGILIYKKKPSKWIGFTLFYKLDVPSNVVQKKRVARILVFKIRPSQEILKIRDGTPLEAEGILTYRKKPSKWIEPSQEILKIRDGTPLEAKGILTYKKALEMDRPRNGSVLHFSSKLDVPSNVVQNKRVAQILVFKIRPSQEILKIRDGPLEAEGILTYRKKPSKWIVLKIRSSQEILKIRDGTPLEAEGILTYRKSPRHGSVWHFSSKLDVPSNVVMNKRVARILVFKIRPSQEILKNRDGTPLEAEIILTYRKKPSKWIEILKIRDEILKIRDGTPLEILVFKIRPSQEILKIRDDVPSNVVQKKRVAWILVLKIRSSQEILKIRDAPLEAEGILTYKKKPSKWIGFTLFYKLDVPSNVVQKKRVARILVFKMRPSQEILKIRDGTHLEAEGILTYRKKPSKWIVFKIRPSQEILKIRDGTPLEWSSQEILKIRDGTPIEAEGILIYKKKPSKWIGFTLFYKLDVPSNVVQKKRVARILVFKIRPSQEILKIRDGTPLEAEGILTYRKKPSKWIVFKIRPSQEILKIRDGTPLEAKGILTYKKALEMDR